MSAQALAVPLQAPRSKPAPTASPVFGDGGGRGGVNVHTALETSVPAKDLASTASENKPLKRSPQVFRGRTIDFLERKRELLRTKVLLAVVDSLNKLDRKDEAISLLGCGRWFQAGRLPCGTVKIVPLHCGSPFCRECARLRAKPYQKKIWDIVRQDKKNIFAMTFTLKSVRDLTRGTIDDLVRFFKEMRERDAWDETILGGFYSIECTWNEKSGWHPHLHVMVKAGGRIPKEWLARVKALWREITGDSYYIHIERMYGVTKNGRKTRRINERAIKELVKYSTKAADFCEQPQRVGEFLDAFKNVRRLQSFGCFHAANKAADESERESEPQKHEKLLAGCVCGGCTWGQLYLFAKVHIADTVLLNDGTRVLSPEYLARAGLDENYLLDSVPVDQRKVEADTRAMQALLFRQSAAQAA